MLKATAKSLIRTVAFAAGPHRWRRGPCLLVLTYHRVLPPDHPDREHEQPGMLVTPELLAMHFETLKRYFTPVHLHDWLRAAREGNPPPGRSVAITFDDGWRDNYDHAFPVIKAADMPVTLFVVTDMVGSRYQFWPNRLARELKRWEPARVGRLDEQVKARLTQLGIRLDLRGSGVTAELISDVIARCKDSAGDAEMHALLDEVEQALPDSSCGPDGIQQRDLLDWQEIGEMAESGLVRFGSHTRRHTRLLEHLPAQLLSDEVAGSRVVLENKLNRRVPIFCYPSGVCSSAAYAAVRESYEGAVGTRHGWNMPGVDPFLVRRIGIHGDVAATPASLMARMTGWPGL